MTNPYLQEYLKYADPDREYFFLHDSPEDQVREVQAREELVQEYSWAIPDDEALDILEEHAPIVEIGAGKGYWAHLLRERGVDVVAYDWFKKPLCDEDGDRVGWELTEPDTFTEVLRGGPEKAADHPDRTLFLCWPPYASPMAYEALTAYMEAGGSRLVYIGEGYGGCTGDDDFHEELETHWQDVQTYRIPQWWAVRDYLSVYHRHKQLS